MPHSIKWVFFDIGSTLVDERAAYKRRIEKTVNDSNISYNAFYDKMLEYYRENKDGFKETAKYSGLKPAPWNSDDEIPYPDAEDCLSKIENMGLKIRIIANQNYGSKERLKKFGLLKYIDLVIASAEEGIAKPNPEIFKIALARAGCESYEAVMVGDRLDNDVVPAKYIGMKTIWIKQGFAALCSVRYDNERPDCIANSLGAIPELLKTFRYV